MKSKQDAKKKQDKEKISRRQATKKLLAGGGIVSAATMDVNKWVKPVVNSAVLPAHADSSDDEMWG